MDKDVDCPGCRQRDARIAELEAKLREFDGKIKDLEAKIQALLDPDDGEPAAKRSKPTLPEAPPKKPTGGKPGGQPGHPPHLKVRLPLERLSKPPVPFIPKTCQRCQAPLPRDPGPNDPEPTWHQVAELPPCAADITEYQGHRRTCPCCGEVTHEAIPDDIKAHSIGPRLAAALNYLSGAQGMSKRAVEETSEHLFGAPIALGTVANLEQEMSAALASAHTEAVVAVSEAPVKNADETGWLEKGQKRWLWVAAIAELAVFIIHPRRSVEALNSLLNRAFKGILISDRWTVYRYWDEYRRQLCWAHLKRNWQALVERGGSAKRIGEGFLEVHRQTFQLWHRFRDGEISRERLNDLMMPVIEEFNDVLERGERCSDLRTRRFCARLRDEAVAVWTFLGYEGIEPTNNHGERVLRFAVIWRRRSFGCQSAAGCRYVERMLTVVQSLRLQKRNIVEFLTESIAAFRNGRAGPRLAPQG